MNENIGRIVVSKAGRDKGRAFIVTAQDPTAEGYVFVVDGELRTLQRPKRKKWKHLSAQPAMAEGIREKLLNGSRIFDAEIRSCLRNLGYGSNSVIEEG